MINIPILIQSLRPAQWIKNGFLLAPLLFAKKLFHFPSLLKGLQAFIIFCILSGAVYLINDLVDIEFDRIHPVKKRRPLAAGLITPNMAKITAAGLLITSLLWGAFCGPGLFLVLLIYTTIQFLYDYRLREMVILDVFCVSSGFFLRVIAGAVAIQVAISHWLIICTVLLSMLLALGKRRQEMLFLGQADAGNHRKVLSLYNLSLLDQMIGIVTAATLLSYMLYCVSPETIEKFKTDHLIYSFPFVFYGIFRYLYLLHNKNQGDAPEKILVSDLPLLVSVMLWWISCSLIVYGII